MALREELSVGGLSCKKEDNVRHVGSDEKSFRWGDDYVTVLTDIGGQCVLEDVAEGRKNESVD